MMKIQNLSENKGQNNTVNQDNIFIYCFEDMKVFGIFDGHGPFGDKVSGYAQTKFLQYIKNSDFLTPNYISN